MNQGSVFDYFRSSSLAGTGLFVAFGILAAIILLAVFGSVYYALHRFRAEPGAAEPSQRRYSSRLEAWLLGGLFVLVSVFMAFTISAMGTIQDIPDDPLPDLIVTGHQWWWEARYPDGDVVVANEIHVPAGRDLIVQLKAADVIHDFWVPGMGRKMDMVPGVDNYVRLRADEPGEYLGACSEFCGAEHARMRLRVIAQPEAEFAAWKAAQARPAVSGPDADFRAGAALFEHKACATCHRVAGTSAGGEVGPDLTHFGSRARFLADYWTNDTAHVRAWLRDPQAVKPGALMPNFILSEREVELLTDYLTALR